MSTINCGPSPCPYCGALNSEAHADGCLCTIPARAVAEVRAALSDIYQCEEQPEPMPKRPARQADVGFLVWLLLIAALAMLVIEVATAAVRFYSMVQQ